MHYSDVRRSMKLMSGFFIPTLAVWLLVVLAIQRPINFPSCTVPERAAFPAAFPGNCRNGHYEEYRSIDENGSAAPESPLKLDKSHSNRRVFRGYGCAAHLFVEFGSYRGGNQTFNIVGLISKPLDNYGHPSFSCEWIPPYGADSSNSSPIEGWIRSPMYPDYGFGRAYSVMVLTCIFEVGVGTDAMGGELILYVYQGDPYGRRERIVALSEKPGDYNASVFDPPYPYDFLYCGSPLHGPLNPRRVQEWVAYHDFIFGERSHFILYDAGGLHEAVREVLLPWIELGRVSIEEIRSTVHLDGYLHNQILMVNDCLHRGKFLANWTLFFDLDEYMYIEPPNTLHSLLAERYQSDSNLSSAPVDFRFTQYRMAKQLCHPEPAAVPGDPNRNQTISKQWGFEKMTYRNLSSTNIDVKFLCNPRDTYAVSIHSNHRSRRGGEPELLDESIVRYYHYHGTIVDDESELCTDLSENVDSAHNFTLETAMNASGEEPSVVQFDGSMVPFALMSKKHETTQLIRNARSKSLSHSNS